MKLRLALSLVALIAVGCASPSPNNPDVRPERQVGAASTEYFKSALAAFMVNSKAVPPSARYAFAVYKLKPLPPGATVLADFENPSNPAEPFTVTPFKADDKLVHFNSPEFPANVPAGSYYARVRVVGADGQLLSTHNQWIWYQPLPWPGRQGTSAASQR